jgi:biotin operon repressor
MLNKSSDYFIRSSKIIRHVLGPKSADVLATLTYKQDYWKKEGKLTRKKGADYFFISHQDITAETCFSASVIAKCIKELKIKGFVLIIRQGLNKPNLYCVNKKSIETFLDNESPKFKKWQEEIRAGKHSRKPKDSRSIKKGVSRVLNIDAQEVEKISTTKNKSTKNKKTKNKNFTNQASLADSSEVEWKLESLINDLRECHIEQKQGVIIKEIFSVLCQFFKPFEKFEISAEDADFISQLGNSEIQIYKIIYKIFENIEHIKEGRKASRFGNLFVGIDKMIANYKNLYL